MPNGMMTTYAGERLEPMARDLVRRGRRERDVMTRIVQEQRSFIAAPRRQLGDFVATHVPDLYPDGTYTA